jgi:hypothetical protein
LTRQDELSKVDSPRGITALIASNSSIRSLRSFSPARRPLDFLRRRTSASTTQPSSLQGLSKRHEICRGLIRVWFQKYEAGAFNEDVQAADLLQQYEARIAALETACWRAGIGIGVPKGL